ncbi:hypothetical protein PG994_011104 [Apiospora phragmitis]|uniref:Uncharacterized protein n=1 Tax=Apiospora phragmitis TaxID=2905665 RepID=A0ABR1TRY5_9PEZI
MLKDQAAPEAALTGTPIFHSRHHKRQPLAREILIAWFGTLLAIQHILIRDDPVPARTFLAEAPISCSRRAPADH